MKKVISVMLALCLMLSVLPSVFAQNPITVFVDSEQVVFDVEPVIENDRTLVPLRAIFEALGATVSWESTTRTAVAEKEDTVIRITIGEDKLYKNDEAVVLDAPARLISDRTLVPVRAISESFGAEVLWNGETRRIDISMQEKTEEPKAPQQTEGSKDSQQEEIIESKNPDGKGNNGYSFDELAPKDMEYLTTVCEEGNLIRYNFEQSAFPKNLFENNDNAVKGIRNQMPEMLEVPRNVWNMNVAAFIMKIQLDSESVYNMDEGMDETKLLEGYGAIAKQVNMTDEDVFEKINFTRIGSVPVLVITFRDTGNILACKYIGVAVAPENKIRYFTAETDVLDKEHLYFCEVVPDGRGTYTTMGFNVGEFIDLIEHVISNNITLNS